MSPAIERRIEELRACDNIADVLLLKEFSTGGVLVLMVPIPPDDDDDRDSDWLRPREPFVMEIPEPMH
jgi:hypothetical protein